jgi:hypothetical protein
VSCRTSFSTSPLLVLEPVDDALLGHQPGRELEVALAVLHAVLPLEVEAVIHAQVERPPVGREPRPEHLVEDLQARLVLPEPRVALVLQQVQRRRHQHADPQPLDHDRQHVDVVDDAVHVTPVAVAVDQQGARVAEQLAERRLRILGPQLELEAVRLRQRLAQVDPADVPVHLLGVLAAERVADGRQHVLRELGDRLGDAHVPPRSECRDVRRPVPHRAGSGRSSVRRHRPPRGQAITRMRWLQAGPAVRTRAAWIRGGTPCACPSRHVVRLPISDDWTTRGVRRVTLATLRGLSRARARR